MNGTRHLAKADRAPSVGRVGDSAASATVMTTPPPRPPITSAKPGWSGGSRRGRPPPGWQGRAGPTGSTVIARPDRSATSRPPRPKQTAVPPDRNPTGSR